MHQTKKKSAGGTVFKLNLLREIFELVKCGVGGRGVWAAVVRQERLKNQNGFYTGRIGRHVIVHVYFSSGTLVYGLEMTEYGVTSMKSVLEESVSKCGCTT